MNLSALLLSDGLRRSLQLVAGLGAVLAFASAMVAQTPYYFWQESWEGGGRLTGTFSGVDLDSDGQLKSFGAGEVTNFSVNFTGNSLVADFSLTSEVLWGFVYDLQGGPFLGDGRTGGIEGIGAGSGALTYTSGQGPNGRDGGLITWGDVQITTGALVMLSDSPITAESYAAAMQAYQNGVPATDITNGSAIPEPSTYALFLGGGALGLAWWRCRRQR